jgi:hypothetical protein
MCARLNTGRLPPDAHMEVCYKSAPRIPTSVTQASTWAGVECRRGAAASCQPCHLPAAHSGPKKPGKDYLRNQAAKSAGITARVCRGGGPHQAGLLVVGGAGRQRDELRIAQVLAQRRQRCAARNPPQPNRLDPTITLCRSLRSIAGTGVRRAMRLG